LSCWCYRGEEFRVRESRRWVAKGKAKREAEELREGDFQGRGNSEGEGERGLTGNKEEEGEERNTDSTRFSLADVLWSLVWQIRFLLISDY
jgi:hypothetical protein